MWGANRMAEDSTPAALRQNARATRVIEVDVGREYGPEVLQRKAHFSDPAFDDVDSARGAGIEEHEATFHRRKEGRNELGRSKELQVKCVDLGHLTLQWASSRPKTALFGNLGVDLRISLCGVQEYASAQILDLLDLARKSLVFASGTAPSPPEFPDGIGLV